ncbi:hypothetical protein [Burkholderia multivorans]|uniref:hypothetical protein n=1 Tax=Burkholderia multivorans TaxID=87883 RepID=UPI0005C6FEEB|nr:hypothetical protein [Burkholderia multivorans]PRF52531.1 hypothetical protein C6Q28_27485 [Burkholderia multivorans]
MTDRVIAQDLAEVSSRPTPGSELPEFQGEVLSRASFGARAATFTPETAIAPVPPNLAATWLAESLAHPWLAFIAAEDRLAVYKAGGWSAGVSV